jgi:hypothetical protein
MAVLLSFDHVRSYQDNTETPKSNKPCREWYECNPGAVEQIYHEVACASVKQTARIKE